MPVSRFRFAWLWLSALLCALSSPAHAGPVELLNAVSISPADPDNIVLTYSFGGSGMFVSQDGGATLKWLCSAGATLPGSNSGIVTYSSGDGSIYVGSYNGLLRGDKTGCGFQPVPELDKKYIRAITGDPLEPQRTYAVTTNAMADNGIYMNDGSGAFQAYGTQARMFIASLHVVKNAEARRFYETGVITNAETNTVDYTVRLSDDEGMTWTDEAFDPVLFETTEKRVQDFKLVAVDPTDPNRVVGLVLRADRAPDSLVFSREQGKAGTWERIAEPLVAGAVAFGPDGALYFGDDNFASKGLYKVSQLGEAPQLLSDVYRVSCLKYDDARSRLLGCADNYRFGSFDTSSGELTTMLDLRCAEHAVTCADNPEIQTLCQPPGVEFCKIDHWVIAPLCCVYERDDFNTFAASQDIVCEGGVAKSKPAAAGEGGAPAVQYCAKPAAGSGGAAAGAGAAGSSGAPAAGSGSPDNDKAGGCGCSSVGSTAPRRTAALFVLVLVGLALRRRRHSGTTCFLP